MPQFCTVKTTLTPDGSVRICCAPARANRLSRSETELPASPLTEDENSNRGAETTVYQQSHFETHMRLGHGRARENPIIFSRYMRRRLRYAGACMDAIAPTGESLFLTMTLPGSTVESQRALAAYSSFAIQRIQAWLYKGTTAPNSFYVWEFQKRGALHLHLAVWIPDAERRNRALSGIRGQWERVLTAIEKKTGVDMWGRDGGGSWSGQRGVLQVRAEVIVKSVGAYLSKYLSKGSGNACKGFAGGRRSPFYPCRWAGISRPLCSAISARTFTQESYISSLSKGLAMVEDYLSLLRGEDSRCYFYRHGCTQGRSILFLGKNFDEGKKIWSYITMENLSKIDASSCLVSRLKAMLATGYRLAGSNPRFGQCYRANLSLYWAEQESVYRNSGDISLLDGMGLLEHLVWSCSYLFWSQTPTRRWNSERVWLLRAEKLLEEARSSQEYLEAVWGVGHPAVRKILDELAAQKAELAKPRSDERVPLGSMPLGVAGEGLASEAIQTELEI